MTMGMRVAPIGLKIFGAVVIGWAAQQAFGQVADPNAAFANEENGT